jgi:uncharacterized protein (DUF2252 family)
MTRARKPTERIGLLTAFDAPVVSPDQRREAGKELRSATPRAAHAVWQPAADRPDPIAVLAESNATRDQDLVPLRFQRMAASPFAFLRGSALVMAHDLATTAVTGVDVQLCGDAHLANFGVFKSPDRRLVFDLNDFDETSPGPFEWDVKRLGASIAVATRENGFDDVGARRAVIAAVSSYADWMQRYSQLAHLDVWYARIDASELLELLDPTARKRSERGLERVANKNHLRALDKLTEVVDGRRQIVSDPPLVERISSPDLQRRLENVLTDYRASLSADRQVLFDRYRFVDFARKVVGVGSVGTRCWIALFQGPNGAPLFLQLKEARASSPQLALRQKSRLHNGQRVVEGQRQLQAASDVLLGWGTDADTGIHYYVRQLWDAKGSVEVSKLRPAMFSAYAGFCGWALARAHARTSDSVTISGYMGTSDRFAEAIADFSEAYADQTVRDHALLVDALERGTLPTT